eukprot:5773750-Prymnesium_polylepis.1
MGVRAARERADAQPSPAPQTTNPSEHRPLQPTTAGHNPLPCAGTHSRFRQKAVRSCCVPSQSARKTERVNAESHTSTEYSPTSRKKTSRCWRASSSSFASSTCRISRTIAGRTRMSCSRSRSVCRMRRLDIRDALITTREENFELGMYIGLLSHVLSFPSSERSSVWIQSPTVKGCDRERRASCRPHHGHPDFTDYDPSLRLLPSHHLPPGRRNYLREVHGEACDEVGDHILARKAERDRRNAREGEHRPHVDAERRQRREEQDNPDHECRRFGDGVRARLRERRPLPDRPAEAATGLRAGRGALQPHHGRRKPLLRLGAPVACLELADDVEHVPRAADLQQHRLESIDVEAVRERGEASTDDRWQQREKHLNPQGTLERA